MVLHAQTGRGTNCNTYEPNDALNNSLVVFEFTCAQLQSSIRNSNIREVIQEDKHCYTNELFHRMPYVLNLYLAVGNIALIFAAQVCRDSEIAGISTAGTPVGQLLLRYPFS